VNVSYFGGLEQQEKVKISLRAESGVVVLPDVMRTGAPVISMILKDYN